MGVMVDNKITFSIDTRDFSREFTTKLVNHLTKLCHRYPMVLENLKYIGTLQNRHRLYSKRMVDIAMDTLQKIIVKNKLKPTPEEIERKRHEFIAHYEKEGTLSRGITSTGEYIDYPIDRVIAAYSLDTRLGDLQGIAIHERYAGDYGALCQLMTEQATIGAHPEGTGEGISTITHEFGHMLYCWTINQGIELVFLNDIWGRCNDIANNDPGNRVQLIWAKSLSAYASVSIDEFFAEAFTEYIHNPQCRSVSKTIGQLTDMTLRGYIAKIKK